jgi:putative MATE family efflux protein
MKTNTKLMTSGSIQKHIVSFTLPIFIGNLFQQLYNTTDSLVVGNFVGKEALAAITSCGPLTFLLVGMFQGIFVGAGVVISTYFGSGDEKSVSKAIHTSLAFGILSGLLLTVIGYFGSPWLLRIMQTPESVFPQANTYIRIYFLGISALILYNTAAGILRAVGDSRHPLYYLIVASIVNIVLDIVFVAVLDLGIAGTAYATIISQSISVFFSFRLLFTSKDLFRVELRRIKFHKYMLPKILRIGIPSGIQNSVTSIANVFVQSSVNLFGATAMAGNGAFMRIQGFAMIPVTSFALALTTYTGQNMGAKDHDRVRKGARFGILFSMFLAEGIGLFLFFNAETLLSFFSKDPQVIAIGMQKAHIVSLLLFPMALSHTMAGLFRGAGKSVVPMVVMLSCWCLFRMLYIKVGLFFLMDVRVVFWAYPITWMLSSVIFLVYYFTSGWMKDSL